MERFSIASLVSSLCNTSTPEFSVDTELDLENQRVISIDVARTKSDQLTSDEKLTLEKMLTLYCKTERVSYKQGMNEILAPFMMLNRQGVALHLCYLCFKNFIEKFIPTMFLDDCFKPIEGYFIITRLILKYHLPDISLLFDKNEITPDIYMTSWYITLFASKIKDIGLLYIFWQTLINKDNLLYLSYFGVAMLQHFRSQLKSHDELTLPSIFKSIYVDNYDTLQLLFDNAEEIRKNMPSSSEMNLNKYNLFHLEKTELFIKHLEKLKSLMILPREILIQTYPHEVVCRCADAKTCKIKQLNYLLIDCRSVNEQRQGYFMNSHLLPKEVFYLPKKLKSYPKKILSIKNTTHIALMATESAESLVLMDLYNSFIEHEFPYISIVEDGYAACHEFALQHEFNIVSHKPKLCLGCVEGKKLKIEYTLDKFFRIEPAKTNDIAFEEISNNKMFRCKLTEEQDINQSDLVLIIDKDLIYLCNSRRKEIAEEFSISKLSKISCNKKLSNVLSFSFADTGKKRVWILESSQVKEFLGIVRENFENNKKTNKNN